MNPFKNLSDEEKRKSLHRMLWIFGITVFVLGWLFVILHTIDNNRQFEENLNYTFYLDGEKMHEILICEDYWHYELIDGFIPCLVNGSVGGINNFDWALPPEENCENVGGNFTGLNIYNETRAKELYNQLLPKCFEISEEEISFVWLSASDCTCLDREVEAFVFDCDEYECGGGLIVKKK